MSRGFAGDQGQEVPLRIVIQTIRGTRENTYRLIAYGGHKTYRPVEFQSLEDVLRTLAQAVPDVAWEPRIASQSDNSILLAEAVELTEEQLAMLGL